MTAEAFDPRESRAERERRNGEAYLGALPPLPHPTQLVTREGPDRNGNETFVLTERLHGQRIELGTGASLEPDRGISATWKNGPASLRVVQWSSGSRPELTEISFEAPGRHASASFLYRGDGTFPLPADVLNSLAKEFSLHSPQSAWLYLCEAVFHLRPSASSAASDFLFRFPAPGMDEPIRLGPERTTFAYRHPLGGQVLFGTARNAGHMIEISHEHRPGGIRLSVSSLFLHPTRLYPKFFGTLRRMVSPNSAQREACLLETWVASQPPYLLEADRFFLSVPRQPMTNYQSKLASFADTLGFSVDPTPTSQLTDAASVAGGVYLQSFIPRNPSSSFTRLQIWHGSLESPIEVGFRLPGGLMQRFILPSEHLKVSPSLAQILEAASAQGKIPWTELQRAGATVPLADGTYAKVEDPPAVIQELELWIDSFARVLPNVSRPVLNALFFSSKDRSSELDSLSPRCCTILLGRTNREESFHGEIRIFEDGLTVITLRSEPIPSESEREFVFRNPGCLTPQIRENLIEASCGSRGVLGWIAKQYSLWSLERAQRQANNH